AVAGAKFLAAKRHRIHKRGEKRGHPQYCSVRTLPSGYQGDVDGGKSGSFVSDESSSKILQKKFGSKRLAHGTTGLIMNARVIVCRCVTSVGNLSTMSLPIRSRATPRDCISPWGPIE